MLKLRNIHNFYPIEMDVDTTLTVNHIDNSGKENVLVREFTNYTGFVDTVITADIFVNGKQNGLAVFIGEGLTPEMVGVEWK